MNIYTYEEAFGAADKTTPAMRRAIKEWFDLYYLSQATENRDPSQRVAYTVVNKLVKTIFGEYQLKAKGELVSAAAAAFSAQRKQAMQLALIGGECYMKPCWGSNGFYFTLIPRNNVLIFGRNAWGEPVDIGTVERFVRGRFYYTLLERRSLDQQGHLVIENKLYRSLNAQTLGVRAELGEVPEYAALAERYRYPVRTNHIGLVQLKTPMVNCVDGSQDGVSVYAAAAGLIRAIDENEAQLNGEFRRGESRILASADMLGKDKTLTDHLFIGLDEDPEHVGITLFSPQLREQSFLARKQEYLRNIESIIGLKRGTLSDSNVEQKTATEISSSAGDYNLTVIDFQGMWDKALGQAMTVCGSLADMYRLGDFSGQMPTVDWGNGILYDEDKTWEDYRTMVASGLLKPELALAWRFNLPAETEADLKRIRDRYMPGSQTTEQ